MGSLDDGYTSGTGHFARAYKKRPNDFKRRIIETIDTNDRDALYKAEKRWLDLIHPSELDLSINRKNGTVRYYNRKRTASGFDSQTVKELSKRRFANGTHNFLDVNFHSESNRKAIANGNAPFQQNPNHMKMMNELSHTAESHKKRKTTIQANAKLGISFQQRPEVRSKMSIKAIENVKAGRSNTQQIHKCPKCQKIGKGPWMFRDHFDKCTTQTELPTKES